MKLRWERSEGQGLNRPWVSTQRTPKMSYLPKPRLERNNRETSSRKGPDGSVNGERQTKEPKV